MSTILYLSGNIYTLDANMPRVTALAIDSTTGRIVAAGSDDEVRRAGGRHTEYVDLRNKTMLPGFIDAHIHLLSTAYRRHHIDAAESVSEAEVAELVRQRASQTPAGQWIQGGRWDKNLWPGQRFPDKASLDAAAPEHPVALWSKDGHLLWVNSLALQRAGITAETPNPATGAILRSGSGEPTGILQEEAATKLVYRVIAEPSAELTRRLVEQTLAELRSTGITTIHDIEGENAFQLFRDLRAEQTLKMRVHMILPRKLLPQWGKLVNDKRDDDDMLRLGGIKIFADGTLGSQTAAMLESFEGNPGNYGILTTPEQEMKEVVSAAAELGVTIAIHAIGDRAAHVALDAIERAERLLAERNANQPPTNLRYRLEHVQLITAQDLERMRRLGVIASVQPYHAVADRDIAERYWGKRHRHAYAYNTMRRMGIPLALGSDAPVELFNPLHILYAATVRNTITAAQRPPWLPDQALPVADALYDYTLGGAYAGAEEHLKGSLTVGKLGDAVVLREDILRRPQEKMIQNSVLATILGGKVVYGDL